MLSKKEQVHDRTLRSEEYCNQNKTSLKISGLTLVWCASVAIWSFNVIAAQCNLFFLCFITFGPDQNYDQQESHWAEREKSEDVTGPVPGDCPRHSLHLSQCCQQQRRFPTTHLAHNHGQFTWGVRWDKTDEKQTGGGYKNAQAEELRR